MLRAGWVALPHPRGTMSLSAHADEGFMPVG
jgi:hypothetical protein